jgi:diketogulonate reductase-like aldo/keto reductase
MTTHRMPYVEFPGGEQVPAYGLGTWRMAEQRSRRADEIAALRQGFELGMTLIDTAEMYASGGAEELVAEALGPQRDKLFIVSKALPQNASRRKLPIACDDSLRRLKTDRLDLYLLHWRGSVSLAETAEAMQKLVDAGKIRHWGVSNLDLEEMEEINSAGTASPCASNQILYNLARRGPQYDLIPWQRKQKISVMAYSPIDQGRILKNAALKAIGARHNASPAQVALAWLIRQDNVITIPKAGTAAHARENYEALSLKLAKQDLDELDRAFPPPKSAQPLGML